LRINRYLSQAGFCSRRKADELIKEGRVYISGRPAQPGDRVKPGDIVEVDGTPVKKVSEKKYFMYHKPKGVICSSSPEAYNNIIEASGIEGRVFAVGRLDVASSGLIFLTNDGDFANRVMHPSFEHEKEYEVKVDRPLGAEALHQMRRGVHILGKKTLPAPVHRKSDCEFRIILRQGLNRQIRRMCEKLNYKVLKIKRIRIMNVSIGNLPPGECRPIKGRVLKELLQKTSPDVIKK